MTSSQASSSLNGRGGFSHFVFTSCSSKPSPSFTSNKVRSGQVLLRSDNGFLVSYCFDNRNPPLSHTILYEAQDGFTAAVPFLPSRAVECISCLLVGVILNARVSLF
jgi:hypothetical protein